MMPAQLQRNHHGPADAHPAARDAAARGRGRESRHVDLVESLMGRKPELRFRFIQENAEFAKDLDI